ncbi:MAG TPA: ABC-F family ATP-binding cassette domain-containing protein [Candidatus Paceibacterota bacterium]|nr:ABC-F family ATP-binding cassette domain-containing protein [Candidatus Paceibacterota bacterium]
MQKTINIRNIVYSHTEKPLLRGVSFKCSENERLCILGENGSGKSTLLKIIAGQITDFEGSIDKSMHMRISYVPQEFESEEFETVVSDYMIKRAGVTVAKRVNDIAKTLGLDLNSIMDRKCGSLSGGQQKLLALSIVLATNPDFILLDEPENHIDIVSRMVLIEMLQEYRGGIIFISHDRLIIDALATKVAEVANGVMHLSEGGYDDYIETKMERIGGMQRQYDAETKRIRQLEATVVILRQKAFRGKEISAYKRKMEELNALKAKHKETDRPEDKKTKIKIHQKDEGIHGGRLLCKMKDGAFHYEGAKADIFRDVDLEIRSNGHIVLLGRNGSGKSTFLKCLIKEWELTKGEVTWTPGIKFSYFDQHARFDEDMTPVEAVIDQLHCMEEDARAVLGSMRFNTDKMSVPIRNLSGGERMRLRFGIVFGRKPDVIIFDEPTNHLDEVTWEILLAACRNSKSTILLVSHDYEFIESFRPSVFWVIHKHTVVPRHKDLGDLLKELEN